MATLDVLTLSEAKAALNLDNSTAHDTELPAWITTASLRLDELCGPVVQRTVTNERHDGGHRSIFLAHHPVSSVTTVTEYDADGTATVLTAEDITAAKTADQYLTTPYSVDPTLVGNEIHRRSHGSAASFPAGGFVRVTYVAGRAATTAAVGERHKTAARLILMNLWRSQQAAVDVLDPGYDVPRVTFPGFAVPRAVIDLLPGEIQQPLPLATGG